jgi:phosphatidate cytidylyltransferase
MAADSSSKDPARPTPSGMPNNLIQRIISGLALAAVALGVLYAGVRPFMAMVLLISAAMCWEWGHIVRGLGRGQDLGDAGTKNGARRASMAIDTIFVIHVAAVLSGVLLAGLGVAALGVIVVVVGALIVTALRFGESGRLSALGVLYVGIPAIALLWLRGDEPYGFQAVLMLLLAVGFTDTGAFIAGRSIGGPKLWPRVSPNKTWSGLIGGVSAAGLVCGLFSAAIPGSSPLQLALMGVLCGLIAQAGDLAESALKRAFGVKDASQLIPGHGGFMDRMDGVVGAAAVAALVAALINMHAPARALLLWH